MEAERYLRLCTVVDQVCPHRRRSREQFGDHLILKVYLWAVLHDRPVIWACLPEHWPEDMRPGELPSQPTMSRRLRTVGLLQTLERTQALLAETFGESVVKQIDSKPLVVGNYSKDRDARRGHAAGTMARGYKIHVIRSGGVARHWTLAGMNVNDQVPAIDLLQRLGEKQGWQIVAGDNQYDANPVHAAAAAANHQLIAPPRKANAQVRDVRRNTAARIRSLELCANPLRACGLGRSFGEQLLQERREIEQTFGHLVMMGMYAPPPWVRRPHRVASWVAAKMVIQMIRLQQIKELRRR